MPPYIADCRFVRVVMVLINARARTCVSPVLYAVNDRGTRQGANPTVLQASRLVAIVGSVSTGHEVLPPDQYVASLARKRMAATAFF